MDSGIRLLLLDSEINEDVEECIISTDNIKAGQLQGSYVREILKPDSQIAVIAHVKNSSTAIEREKGLREGLGREAGENCGCGFCDSNYDKDPISLCWASWKRHPDVDVVVGLNEYSAVGAARAIVDKRPGRRNPVLWALTSSLEEIKMLEAGIFPGHGDKNPFKMGYLGVGNRREGAER